MNLHDLVAEAKGEPLDEAEDHLVTIVSAALMQYGSKCVGDTVIAGLTDEDAAFIFKEDKFRELLRKTDLLDVSKIDPLEPTEVRVVILFPSGHAFCANIVNRSALDALN